MIKTSFSFAEDVMEYSAQNLHYSNGFTLAEVLITLGIIGVVAALTIANITAEYQKRVTVERLKKAYSIASNAFKASESHNGPANDWAEWNSDTVAWYRQDINLVVQKYIQPYLNVSKFYPITNVSGRAPMTMCKDPNDNNFKNYVWLSGVEVAQDGDNLIPSMLLSDGSCLGVSTYKGVDNKKKIYVDINGPAKPNKAGKDLFFFILYPDNKILPEGYELSDSELISNSDMNSCVKHSTGGKYCAAKIMKDGWKITKNYPW